ncbi:hypothetical protein DB728_09005 [Rhizobium leguminosarum bv. viciae USDA 2370]|jgi:hypothetical protein|uniref:Transmembrane protein n=1 Tax=Rhizobium leguminosarum bv. trifolii (strain WSM1325) TaxID=395491 RepID=C6B713_RHILS|nr:hypothetical protein Rleg_6833 [Rhizobium leguminosarum bv. trifolii WSM1325]MBB5261711.1 hypothetical protein [Rhizobium leguminosarum]OOO44803.1 hypothetical protein BS629_26695 [Rhizobium leguminosarum bv. viciae USDA 2370]TBZ50690.1 hypothetical protein E0H42_20825 [Rhizobium leguminosarum bv. viciae]PUB64855.1 hypothetical protein DB728_09005 [Rhizobium leguminosarum bv. viciae USDA 2370]
MSHRNRKPSGSIFPGVAILFAMAALVGALVSIQRPAAPIRVWVPAQSGESRLGGEKSLSTCSPVWAGCNPSNPV